MTGIMGALMAGGFPAVTRTITSTGTDIIPPGASNAVIESWGGSNTGGNGVATGGGGGGGSGGYCRTAVSVIGQGSKTISITINGVGASTVVASGTFTLATMTANGGSIGNNGTAGVGGTGGAGGTATGGTAANTTGTTGGTGASGGPTGAAGGVGIVGINGTGPAGGHGVQTLSAGLAGQAIIKYT